MKKSILALTLSVLMAASLAGCSKQLSNEYITVKQYDGLEVAKVETAEVTDENVESVIDTNLGTSAADGGITDREAQNGDKVNIDYVGSIDGTEFEGGSDSGAILELGSGSFIGANGDYKGFEEQIVGHKSGDKFDITVQFPADYQDTEKANKAAVFNITLNGIVPELTDDWVKKNSEESKTVEEYKNEIKKQLEDNNKESMENTLQNNALEAIVDQVEVKKYPDGAIDEQVESIKEYYTSMAAAYGMEFKDFVEQAMQMTEEDFEKQAKEAAETAVKRKLACELIAKKKNLEPSDKEYEEQIAQYAEDGQYESVEDFKEQVGEDTLKNAIRQQKVGKYLADNCVQVEQSSSDTGTAE